MEEGKERKLIYTTLHKTQNEDKQKKALRYQRSNQKP